MYGPNQENVEAQGEVICALADTYISKLGPHGALKRVSEIEMEHVMAYVEFVSKARDKGQTSVEMTEEVIHAYNEMVWSTALLTAVVGKINEGGTSLN